MDDRRVLWFRPKSNQMPSQGHFLYFQYDRCFTLQHIKCVLNNPVSYSHWSESRSHRLRPCGPFTFSASLAFLQVFIHHWVAMNGLVNGLFLSSEREMLLAEDSRTLIITTITSELLAMTTAFTLIKLWSYSSGAIGHAFARRNVRVTSSVQKKRGATWTRKTSPQIRRASSATTSSVRRNVSHQSVA